MMSTPVSQGVDRQTFSRLCLGPDQKADEPQSLGVPPDAVPATASDPTSSAAAAAASAVSAHIRPLCWLPTVVVRNWGAHPPVVCWWSVIQPLRAARCAPPLGLWIAMVDYGPDDQRSMAPTIARRRSRRNTGRQRFWK